MTINKYQGKTKEEAVEKAKQELGAGAVVLACGGIGGLYKNSTNYPHITGDAIAMALRHGVACRHLDYIEQRGETSSIIGGWKFIEEDIADKEEVTETAETITKIAKKG